MVVLSRVKRKKLTVENCIMRAFMVGIFHQHY